MSRTQPQGLAAHWPQVYISVALTTLATLLLELGLTRIFSVVFYYHFAFLAISIALFGLGAGGVFSYVVAGWRGNVFSKLGWLSAANGVLVMLSLLVVLLRQAEPDNWALALIYCTTALPFFVAGAMVSLAISETIERVDKVYFFDLLGAAGGCLLLVPFLNTFGGPNTVIIVAAIFAAGGALWHSIGGSMRGRAVSVLLALGLVGLVTLNLRWNWIDVRYAKGHKLQNEEFVKWNSFSRIALGTDGQSPMKLIFIDADASTGIANFDFQNLSERDRSDLLHQGPGFPYAVRPEAKVLIIGPGGGWDVARALAAGAKHVTGVEINPIIAGTIMKEKFPQLSRNLYHRPDVRIEIEDGRSFIRRSTEKYDVIQATLVDTWASTAAGAFALSENNLYTVEAFHDYFSHLTDSGLLAMTRWGFEPPRESLRLISLSMEALKQLGENEPWKHVIVAREGSQSDLEKWGAKDTVLVSRKPFTADALARAREALAKAKMTAVYLPDEKIPNAFTRLLHSPDPQAFYRDYPFDVSPVTDNRPFFFYTVQPRDVFAFLGAASRDTADFKINRAVPLLFGLMAISIVATIVILALPPVVLGTRLPRQRGVLSFLPYFLFIGAGYILIEVALIQKFVLFLGHPTYALTVVIFSMLVSSGLGSYFSRTIIGDDPRRWRYVLGSIPFTVAALGVSAGALLSAGVGLPVAVKIVITIALIAPAGFLMGMPFPTGLRLLERWHSPSLRWAWSLNAASSVLGSVGALVCAIYLGLVHTLFVGAIAYAVALFVASRDYTVSGEPDLGHDHAPSTVPAPGRS